ncbi:SDR family NAD(P)-dependent oxidoreductase [Aureimonas sp. AU4]|uniref:SDR family NAD(P)-dependent oxidoreductase n=1 Tax=Aureimonas sp. AU4 TaxID=1638163 RepID=UPI000782E7AF|nr:SDR family oxidoreductase [Aureimonas sp. AU4]
MRLTLEGRRFAVTGASQGIGRAIVRDLVASGARVAALDIDADGLRALEGSEETLPRISVDLGRREDAHRALADAAARLGGLDGLVTAAGGVRGQVGRPLEAVGEADFAAIMDANLMGALWCAQAATPYLKRSQAGRIVTISSGAGLRPSLTGIQAYASAKHALVGLTRQLALELGPAGITVNSVAPGFVLSNPSTERQWEAFGPERQRQVIEGTHMRRLGTPEDISAAVLFLLSAEAAWITGQILSVDGGRA